MVLSQSEAEPYYKEQGKLYEGQKRYELSNHLGNVLAVINDRKTMTTRGLFNTFDATIISAQDYFPFGLEMGSERQVSNTEDGYRYGFNGKKKDEDGEWGSQTHYDYGFRIYNPSIGKFLSVDPLSPKYPWYTPYQFAGNMPIWARDLDGLEEIYSTDGTFIKQGQDKVSNEILIKGNAVTLITLLKLQAKNGINDKHKIRSIVRNQRLDKIFSTDVVYEQVFSNYYLALLSKTEEGEVYGVLKFNSNLIDAVVNSENQKTLDILISILGHEYLHLSQQSTGLPGNENQPARELLAHHFNLFPNTTVALDGTDFEAGVTTVFNPLDEYVQAIYAHQALKYIDLLSDKEKEEYSSLINDVHGLINDFKDKGYVFPEVTESVSENLANFNSENKEKQKEAASKNSNGNN